MIELARVDWEEYKNRPPVQQGLVVYTQVDQPHYLELKEGDFVDVLEWQSEKDLVIVRSHKEEIGFYAASSLKTEEEIFEAFRLEEDVRLCQEIETAEERARQAEADYDRQLRERMKQKAEEDRIQREIEAQRRREEAERLLQEIEERKAWEAQQERERVEMKRLQREKAQQEAEMRRAQLKQEAAMERQQADQQFMSRLEQKEAERKAWEAAEAARKDKE